MSNKVEIGVDISKYPVLEECMYDPSRISIVTGPAGSAKTSIIGALKILRLACEQEPAPADNVRYTSHLVGRSTYQQLESATIKTFRNMLEPLFTFKTGSIPPSAYANFPLPDGTRVDCIIEFLSFDSEDAQQKLLGFEPTTAFLDEISELPESLIFAVNRRLGRYPSGKKGRPTFTGLTAATNGPKKNHWLYDWSQGARDEDFKAISKELGRNFVRIHRQPPGLLRQPDGTWLPNPKAENVQNLEGGYAYYYAMLADGEEKIKSYVEGEFADLVSGKLVFNEFNRELHVLDADNFDKPYYMPLYLSFDFGRTPVCIFATTTTGGRLIIIDEVTGENMSIDTLVNEKVKPLLREKYPGCPVEGAWGDPSGISSRDTTEASPFSVILDNGIPIADPGSNKLQPRIEIVKQLLTRLDSNGKPALQVLSTCKYTLAALSVDYIYEKQRGSSDLVKEVPTKSHVNWVSDLADSVQYLCLGYTSQGGGRERKPLPKLKSRFI